MTQAVPRKRTCASCPYREDSPSGIWAEEEYNRLPAYDAETGDQPPRPFHCHQADGRLCSGWVATHGPHNLLAVRVGVAMGTIDPIVFDYETSVPVFESGQAARDHGVRDIQAPSERAVMQAEKIIAVRSKRDKPVEFT